ncbi:MFS transporter [Streptomyces phaeolivaceus]|uniref:MFS transporter n=1 Tax=Streptomyces phaeolivaceus TaxID=2653200 RepID=A0A5P8KEV5_9ACTN|nr:MFS transporter [Streptomyces phaeolivaceus]QFR01545.1 MFS transporter [Streptomyces phaeolivaceus]
MRGVVARDTGFVPSLSRVPDTVLRRTGFVLAAVAVVAAERATGRYAYASLAVGLYALAGVAASPVIGRLADRLGPSPVLLGAALAHAAALAVLVLTVRDDSGLPLLCATAVTAGATYPPLTPAIRRACNQLTAPTTGRGGLRGTVLAADTALYEFVFVVGPLLVGIFGVVATPAAAILAAAGVMLAGTTVLAGGVVMRAQRPQRSQVRTGGLGPLRSSGFTVLLGCVGALGAGFGAVGVAVPAYATQHSGHDSAGLTGLLLAVWGLGSGLGGLWYGAWPPRSPLPQQLAWLLGCVSVSLAALAVMPGPTALGAALVLGGGVIAPCLTVYISLVGRIVPTGMLTEAHTWIATVPVAANAVGVAQVRAARVGVVRVRGAWGFGLGHGRRIVSEERPA